MSHDYKTPVVVGLFLINFHVKEGYKLVWSKLAAPVDLTGIEFKCLPSGIEKLQQDVILMKFGEYYGLSKFRSNVSQTANDGPLDRASIRMYSLGILCQSETSWEPNRYISNGFEYLQLIDDYLINYINSEDLGQLNTLYDTLRTTSPALKTSPLMELPKFFNTFGPLVFQVYKLSLLRKRILIFNQVKKNNYLHQAFGYLISVLSVIPQNLRINYSLDERLRFIQPLYNICLNDLEAGQLPDHYVATTNDDILMYQDIYDYAIVISEEYNFPVLVSREDFLKSSYANKIKSTYNDYLKFKLVYEKLFFADHNGGGRNALGLNKSTDNLSVHTSSSIFSNLKWFNNETSIQMNYEPNWWLNDITTPQSWTQSIWLAFSWFASAGQISQDNAAIEFNHENHLDAVQFIGIIGYFHKLTKKWIYILNDLIKDEYEIINGIGTNIHDKIVFKLTYQDMEDLELDPYSAQDFRFVTSLVLQLWPELVDAVQVISGVDLFC